MLIGRSEADSIAIESSVSAVVLDAVDVSGGRRVISCAGTVSNRPQLLVSRSRLVGAASTGVFADGCGVQLIDSELAEHKDGAVELRGSTYRFAQLRVVRNQSPSNAAVRLSNDTIAGGAGADTIEGDSGDDTIAGGG